MKKEPRKKVSRKKRKKTAPKNGDALLNHVIKLTGLPRKDLKNELKDILERKNINIQNLNLGQLRCAAASYVREIMTSLMDKYTLKKTESLH